MKQKKNQKTNNIEEREMIRQLVSSMYGGQDDQKITMTDLIKDGNKTGRILNINVGQYKNDCLKQLFGINIDTSEYPVSPGQSLWMSGQYQSRLNQLRQSQVVSQLSYKSNEVENKEVSSRCHKTKNVIYIPFPALEKLKRLGVDNFRLCGTPVQ